MPALTERRPARRHRRDKEAGRAASELMTALFAAETSALQLLARLRQIDAAGCIPSSFPRDAEEGDADYLDYLCEMIKNIQVNAYTGRTIIASHVQPGFDPTRFRNYTASGKVVAR
jgi:hypothetical protein